MAKKPLPCPAVLRQQLRYDADTGKLFWLKRDVGFFASEWAWKVWSKRFPGKEAFTCPNSHGYLHGSIMGKDVLAYRVIWALHYGAWPEHQLDHIDNDRANNRISNLRDATNSQNHMNKPASSANNSGFKGVDWSKKDKVWRARIKVRGKQIHLGHFSCVNEAAKAYAKASTVYHGEFARLK